MTGFLTTRWSVVRRAGTPDAPEARAALEELCAAYWAPLYAFLRRRGEDPETARDLTQSLFASLLERRDLGTASPDLGRFRSWLLACLRHHVADEKARERAAKRGGDRVTLSLDVEAEERRLVREPADERTPEREFERRWALCVIDRAFEATEASYLQAGRAELFAALREHLVNPRQGAPLAEVAEGLGMSESAVKVALHRARRRLGERLRAEIAQLVDDPRDVEEELGALFEALA